MKRRTLLAVAGTTTVPLLAGCLGGDEDDEQDGSETDGGDNVNDTDAEGNQNETDGGGDESDTDENGGQNGAQPLFSESFSATSRGGFLAIDEAVEGRAEAQNAGFVLPSGEDILTLEAEVAEDGSWESTEAAFPTVEITNPIRTDVRLELPDGLSGTIATDRMTATGTIQVVIEELDAQFSFEFDATSGESGALQGETNFEEEPLTATLVDNEFTIDEGTGNFLVDGQLGLPAEEPGTNWFEISVELIGT